MLRIAALGIFAGGAAACSSSSHAGTSPGRTTPSSGSSPPLGTSATARPSAALQTGRVVALGGTHVAAGAAISEADARRFAPFLGGRWRGAWRDTAGRSGTSDLLIAVNVRARTVRATVDVGGSILGGTAPLAPITYEFDLLGFARDAPAWTVQSPQLGKVVATASGGDSLTGTASNVPGHPEIASIALNGTRLGGHVSGRYTITGTDGKATSGTIAWGKGAQRAVPTDPNDTSSNSIADVMSGQYAASFATGAALTPVMGRPTLSAVPNGGRVAYAVGINVSNALATTVDGELVVQYSVYRGDTPAHTAAFWQGVRQNNPTVKGPWTAGFFQFPNSPTFYAYQGSRVLLVNITPTVHAKHPPAAGVLAPKALAVAKLLVPMLNSR